VGGSGIETKAVDLYDAFAPYYREYSQTKSSYLAAVEKYVIEHIPEGATSLLDVGAGDGVRGMIVAKERKMRRVVLAEPSREMAERCRKLQASEVWQLSAEDLPSTGTCFDTILCLWNVLGHIETRGRRLKALRAMQGLLSERGRIFIDVNNRHNAAAYGSLKVLGRRLIDSIRPDERRGDATFDWKIGDAVLTSMGHLFTPAEVETLFKSSGLKTEDRVSVDYASGSISKSVLKGQLLYTLSCNASKAGERQ
jgi:2-polyprenyl-3-methyl-5-hydroxy-6-metoxy-1,4-benzoquinol methylase